MLSLTIKEIEHVARLARLELSAAEKEEFTGQLNEILNFVEQLNQIDTTGIEPTAHAMQINNVYRPDQVKPSLDLEQALSNAPDRIDNFFKVPKTLED